MVPVVNSSGTDNRVWDVVDFGAAARDHATGSAQPWFGPDGVHLNTAGVAEYRKVIADAARRCADAVVAWGEAGTFTGAMGDQTRTATGQRLATRSVDGWAYGQDRVPYLSAVAADGTVFNAQMSRSYNAIYTAGGGMAATALDPTTRTAQQVRIKTSKGREAMQTSHWEWDNPDEVPYDPEPDFVIPAGRDVAMDMGDIVSMPDTNTMAFTGASPNFGWQDVDADGYSPVFGILSRQDDSWGVASASSGGQP